MGTANIAFLLRKEEVLQFWPEPRCQRQLFFVLVCVLVFPSSWDFPNSAEWDAVIKMVAQMRACPSPQPPLSQILPTPHTHWDKSQFLEAQPWLRTLWSLFLNFKMRPQAARGTFGTLAVTRKEKAMVWFLRRRFSIFRWEKCSAEKHSKSWSKIVICE